MIFHPENTVEKDGKFTFCGNVNANAHPCLNKSIIKEFWHGFTFHTSHITITENDGFIFSIGNAEPISLDGFDYTINITASGICVYAENEKNLIYGFMTLLDRFRSSDYDGEVKIEADCCQIKDKPLIKSRMVHFCIFPETELWELQRFIRFCGALKYTHIILEFWGMFQYKCLKELSWSTAFSKEQLTPILNEAKDLGLEIIPMFNHWGHASAGRVWLGKHVVLDQNPSLQTYFSEDGWCWDIRKDKVKNLLRQIRNELIDLCGSGSYFHIGCDEAYNFSSTKENINMICDFINEIVEEMRLKDRRVIAWGDMILYKHSHYNPKTCYTCNAPSPEVEEYMLQRLNKDLIFADWQYDATEAPVETASVFKKAGFDCLLCPWDRGIKQMSAVISTVKDQELMGFLHTTWHTLSEGMPYVLYASIGGFEEFKEISRTYVASFLRKVMFVDGDYSKSGWSKIQMGSLW